MQETGIRKGLTKRQKEFLFFICLLALPLAQFCIFYIGVNFNSLLLTFRNYDFENGFSFAGFDNITRVWHSLTNDAALICAVKNSLVVYAASLLIGTTLALVFSYFIYKKAPLAGLYRVVLFLPSIISSIVMVTLYKYFCEEAIPGIYNAISGKSMSGLLSDSNTSFATLLFYLIWTGFGTQVLMYTGAMCNVPESLSESAKIDGANHFVVFSKVVVPLSTAAFSALIIFQFL